MADPQDAASFEPYRAVQKLAYECAESVAASLEAGVTEKEAARRLRVACEARGADDWFHLPFAWFGDRTAFAGFRHPLQFFPTNRRLRAGMPFILDCAPVVRGVAADVGYSSALGGNDTVERILDDLLEHRALILDLVRKRRTLAEVYLAVGDRLAAQGYQSRHRAYPFGVLAHRIVPMSATPGRGTFGRFGTKTLLSLGRSALAGMRGGFSPLWSGWRFSDHPPTPGLWAVEPHFGKGDVGAKFEELLVITATDAYWLDDDLPHVRRARHEKAAAA